MVTVINNYVILLLYLFSGGRGEVSNVIIYNMSLSWIQLIFFLTDFT